MKRPDDDLLSGARALPNDRPAPERRSAVLRACRSAGDRAARARVVAAALLALACAGFSARDERRVARSLGGPSEAREAASIEQPTPPHIFDTGVASRVFAARAHERVMARFARLTPLDSKERSS